MRSAPDDGHPDDAFNDSPYTTTRRRLLTAAGLATAGVATAGLAASASGANTGSKTGWVNRTLGRMTPEEKVGQLFVIVAYGNHATDPAAADQASNRATYGVCTPKQIIDKYAPGGLIYFTWSNNLQNPVQVATLSNGVQRASLERASEATTPLLIAIDQEHGVVLGSVPR